ncbi:MAG TPA: glycosyltransferase family 39 protein [Chloroflexota bacterium]|nr:glycosyltransferase family 39 protein [Chloroflexota bacterium]
MRGLALPWLLGPLAIIGVAAAFRFWNLLGLPLFVDESLWLRWALNPYQYLPRGASPLQVLRVSLIGDVNPPLLHWILLAALAWTDHPVWGARAVTATCGTLAALGTYLLGTELFNRRVGAVAGLVHAVLPLAVFFDRLIHYDALTAMCVVYTAWLSARLARHPSKQTAIALGIMLAAAIVANPRGATILPAPALAFLLLRRAGSIRQSLVTFATSYAIAALLAPLSFIGVPLDDVYKKIFGFGLTPGEMLAAPTEMWDTNLALFRSWIEVYIGFDLLKLAVLGMLVMLVWRPRAGLYMLLLWLGLVLPFILGGRQIYSRYLAVSAFPPSIAFAVLVVAAAWLPGAVASRLGLHQRPMAAVLGGALSMTTLMVGLTPPIQASISMVTDPLHAHIPDSDRSQYQDGWYAGVGVPEAAQYLLEVSRTTPLILLREDGMPGSGVHFYTYHAPNIRDAIEPALSLRGDNSVQRVRRWLEQSPNVYFVAIEDLSGEQPSRSRRFDEGLRGFPEAHRVAEFPSRDGDSRISVFKIEPRGG